MALPTNIRGLIDRTLDELFGPYRGPLNRLDGAIDSAVETLTFELDLNEISPRSYICIDTELLYVASTGASKQATCWRGQGPTAAAAHVNDSLVEVGWRFPSYKVHQALCEELESLDDELYAIQRTVVPMSDQVVAVTLPRFLEHLTLEAKDSTGELRPEIGGRVVTLQDGSLELHLDYWPKVAIDVTITWAQKFDLSAITTTTTTLASIGLPNSMVDVLALGTAYRLMAGDEASRSDQVRRPVPRSSNQNSPSPMRTAASYLELASLAKSRERDRLRAAAGVHDASVATF